MSDALHDNDTAETPPSVPPAVPELSQLLVHLLKGVLYREDDERLWANLLRLQARVREHAAVLLLDGLGDRQDGDGPPRLGRSWTGSLRPRAAPRRDRPGDGHAHRAARRPGG